MNNINQYAVKCLKDEAQAILDLIPQLTEDFSRSIDLIYNCRGRFIITGVGKSGHIGAKIAATLASTGTPSFFVNPLDAYHGDLGMFTSDDVVMAISYSGNTDELLRFIPLLLERRIPIIGMSGNPNSLLAQYSNYHLNISVNHEACPLNLAPTSSTTATLAMGDAIACALMRVRHFKASDFAQFHPGGTLGKRLLTNVSQVMRKDKLPVISSKTVLYEALATISDGRIGLAAVVDKGILVGLVTDGDIRRTIQKSKEKSFNIEICEIMNKNPICVYETDKISTVEKVFAREKVNTLVVLDDKKMFCGFVTYQDCMY
ncbi:KpsF/GutQ family sugar-phosphate isomerase [Bacteroides ovatus]|jgi:sugar isomerase, kpsF/gutQ family|uniref:KpsF/GutQ family sugar-phosphate isomerase n=1 Tax=Bacteroides TaxID=816 RepID=UPI000ECBF514|nr:MULTISPECIES: KpsF/GutQ family sugar-phosphate isomerase [Bacteroides]RJU52544.1 KpsF/GutQ family sugar-phosphate isomerase [Bacteroides sp. CF01-10NS]MDC2674346.1 KpsF/GutQ family sugar-phosphate isomerase [Bacteroides ovatus]MDC2694659.1 KpsF/GutQ family sugar-phosphate isomerase [Bacteroides ovatus]MDC2699635.1 KpsF/GutQ family sugar-phosphate isomerase [Bacteroides ovatus]MDC2714736.1 KpsF/GutQ family sugar-phosphate isomerase [Bacteroides ovatus]